MKLIRILRKIVAKVFYITCRFIGRDVITFAKIKRRHDLKEIGSEYGGWVVPVRQLDSDSVCYCVGCGEDISFDLGLIDRFGCEVFAFDPTPRAIKHVEKVAGQKSQYHFFEIGVWNKEGILKFYVPKNPNHVSHSILNLQKTEDYISVKVKRLKNIIAENGHSRVDLLKLDIEGAEYKVIESIVEDNIDIKIICVEYDECFNPVDNNYRTRIRNSVRKLRETGYSLVYTQGNGNYTFIKNV